MGPGDLLCFLVWVCWLGFLGGGCLVIAFFFFRDLCRWVRAQPAGNESQVVNLDCFGGALFRAAGELGSLLAVKNGLADSRVQ
jgi:hypothetical protein